ncbi:hypothetical protein MBANPS3_006742 [Mucor bainieri]
MQQGMSFFVQYTLFLFDTNSSNAEDMEPFVEYSGIDPELLIYQGKQYEHLRRVLEEKTRGVILSAPDTHVSFSRDSWLNKAGKLEHYEEKELLSQDTSKYSDQLAKVGISFEKVTVGPLSVDLNRLVPAVIQGGIQVGGKIIQALQPFGNTRVEDALTFADLGAVTPHVQHLLHLGDALEYDQPSAVRKNSGLQITHASSTFEEGAKLMPILQALLFCGSLYNGNDFAGTDLRQGFTLGMSPPTPNRTFVDRHKNGIIRQLVDEMWRKGTCYTASPADRARWERWKECNDFDPRSRAKASSIRDLVRFCWNKSKVAFVVQDMESAAIAFGLAQVNLCRIDLLDMGPVDGVTVFGKNEHQSKAVYLEPSLMMQPYRPFPYDEWPNALGMCNVPIESREILIDWLGKQIDNTHLLGIANGDAPGTVILTPEFFSFARAQCMSHLGQDIAAIAVAVSQKCTVCAGKCKSLIFKQPTSQTLDYYCTTTFFLNMMVTVYIGGVLRKAGMHIDQCTLSCEGGLTVKALHRLESSVCSLGDLLASWFMLRSGREAPSYSCGRVLGIEMEGQVHGLRHAVEPGTTGSPLVSFPGHIYEGRQTCACLVFEWCDRSNGIMLDQARSVEISEQGPDVQLQQLLFIRSKPDYIAVDTCLAFPDGRIVQVQLGRKVINRHRCVEVSEHLHATPLQVSECTDGSSTVDTLGTGLRFALHSYGNEAIQSWLAGLFDPLLRVWFQGRRSLAHSLALLKEGDILIQGFSSNQDSQNLEREVGRLSIEQ